MQDITTPADLDAILDAPQAILLKHGMHCPISANARRELDALVERHPELTVGRVEVTERRALSDAVADRLGVPHASPQIFLVREGAVAWQATHFEITARALEERLGG